MAKTKHKAEPEKVETPQERQARISRFLGETAAVLTFYLETHGLREGVRLALEDGFIPAKWKVENDRVIFEIGPEIVKLLTFEGSLLLLVVSGHRNQWDLSELPEQPRFIIEASCEVVDAWESGKMHEYLGVTPEALQKRLNREGLWWLLWNVTFEGFVRRIQSKVGA